MKALISYQRVQRVETFPFPEDAIREAVINAVLHKDYGCGIPIQISIYDDQVYIWSQGQLPDDYTMQDLLDKHASHPYNPDIANTFFRSGYIESWGRGLVKIRTECTNVGLPEPTFTFNRHGLMVHFRGKQMDASEKMAVNGGDLAVNDGNVAGKVAVNGGKLAGKVAEKIMVLIEDNAEITVPELSANVGISIRTTERIIQKLQKENRLKRIGGANGGQWEVVK